MTKLKTPGRRTAGRPRPAVRRLCPGAARSRRPEGRGGDGERLFPAAVRRSASGKQIGWEYDAINEIAKRLNFTVEYQNTSWDAMIQAVSDKQYDIGMTGITIKDERKQKVDFSDPYMRSEIFMLVRGDESRFTDAKSFAADEKLLIGAQAGTSPFYVAVYNVLDGNEQNPRIKLFETFARLGRGAAVRRRRSGADRQRRRQGADRGVPTAS